MKTNILLLILTLVIANAFGQITYEKGYFINNENQRVECLIKNMDWKKNPKGFEYKLSENCGTVTGILDSVKEFGVTGYSRYVRANIEIDRSPMEIANFSKQYDPEWSQERLFLKVLVEGKATLYYFDGDGLIRFFYSISDTSIKQLIFKEYFTGNGEVARNSKFREQLWANMRCPIAKQMELAQINYWNNDLESYFIKFNECNGISPAVYGMNARNDIFHLRITPGINYSSISVTNTILPEYNTEFNHQLGFRIGIEAEAILPFNKNKWGVLFEPTYQYFNASKQFETYAITAQYHFIEFPVGLRYYFFLNPELKLFLNATYLPPFAINFNSTILIETPYYDKSLEIKTTHGLALGGGISIKRISTEFIYYSNRNVLLGYNSWYADYNKVAIIFAYKFF